MASKLGSQREIATQGISSPDGLGIATQGFIEPILGDIIFGGCATVSRTFGGLLASGGLVFGGAATANLIVSQIFIGSGGLVISGAATIVTDIFEFGRGGAKIPPRRRAPKPTFEPPVWNPDDYLQPIDYLKKIQDYLNKAERDKLQLLKHISKGTIKISGRGKVIVIYRDKPDGEMIVANNPPLEPIVLELPNVFSKGISALEIAELEDHLLLNDLLGLGDYIIKTGPKQRFVHRPRKTTGGAAKVKFISGAGIVKHVSMVEKWQRAEDEEFLLELNMRDRQDQEEEELRLLGIID